MSAVIREGWDIKETETPTETCLETKEPTPTSLNHGFYHNAVDRPDSSSWEGIDLGAATRAVGTLRVL